MWCSPGKNLGPLLFLIYINDLPHCLTYSKPRIYADDTSLTLASTDIEHTAVSTKVVSQKRKNVRDKADWCNG